MAGTSLSFDNMTKVELARTGYQTEAARDYNGKLLEGLGAEMVKGDIRDLVHLLDATASARRASAFEVEIAYRFSNSSLQSGIVVEALRTPAAGSGPRASA